MGSFSGDNFPTLSKFNDSINATCGAILAFVLLILVCIISVLERPVFGENQLTPTGLDYFIKGEAGIIIWFMLVAAPGIISNLLGLFAKATRIDPDEDDTDILDTRDAAPGSLLRIITNLWVPVTLQFCLVGWLIYASGGPENSPYAYVLLPMMIIGQSIYPAPPIQLDPAPRMREVLLFLLRFVCYYIYPLALFGFLLVGLALLQAYHPMVTTSGPAAETIVTAQLSLFVSMCAVFVTRRLDRTSAPGTG